MSKTGNFILQESESEGTGVIVLSSLTGWRSFADVFDLGSANQFYYFIRHVNSHEMEVGLGHLIDEVTLQRDTILDSTNGGNIVNFTDGIKEVTNTLPASRLNETDTGITIFDNNTEIGETFKINAGIGLSASKSGDTINFNVISGTGGTLSGTAIKIEDDGQLIGNTDRLNFGDRLHVFDPGTGTFTISGSLGNVRHDTLSGIGANDHHVPPTLSTIFGDLTDAFLKLQGDVLSWGVEDVSNNLQLKNQTQNTVLWTIDEKSGELFGDEDDDTPHMLGRGATLHQSSMNMPSGTEFQLHRLIVPSGTSMGIYSAGISDFDGNSPSTLQLVVKNHTSGTEEVFSGTGTYTTGNVGQPITTLGTSFDELSVEVWNRTGATTQVSSFLNFRIDEGDPNQDSRTGDLLRKQVTLQQSSMHMPSGTEIQLHRMVLPSGTTANIYATGISKYDGTTDPNLNIEVLNITSGTTPFSESSSYNENKGEPLASVGFGPDELEFQVSNKTGSLLQASAFMNIIIE